MKKLRIDALFLYEIDDVFRPSTISSVRDSLHKNMIFTIKDVCMMKESDFRLLPAVTDEAVKRVKERMEFYGLRFGMTEEELVAYQDEEFLLKHPEEVGNTLDVDDSEEFKETTESKEPEDPKTPEWFEEFKEPVWLDVLEGRKVPEEPEVPEEPAKKEEQKEEKDELAEVMGRLAPYAKRLRDEIDDVHMRQHIMTAMREAYIHQPWWVKLFCTSEARYRRAWQDTLYMCGTISTLIDTVKASDNHIFKAYLEKKKSVKQ